MKVVRPRFQNRDNCSAVGISVGSVGVRCDNSEFGDRIRGGVIADEIVLGFVVIRPFHHVVVGLLAIAINGHDTAVIGVPLDGIVPGQAGRVGGDRSGLVQR